MLRIEDYRGRNELKCFCITKSDERAKQLKKELSRQKRELTVAQLVELLKAATGPALLCGIMALGLILYAII